MPLIEDFNPVVPGKLELFTQLLSDIRKLRTFICLPLFNSDLESAELNQVYSLISKAIVNSTLKLMGKNAAGISVSDLVALVNSKLTTPLSDDSSLYAIDSTSLQKTSENALLFAKRDFELSLRYEPAFENEVLEQIKSAQLPHLGFMSKGIIYAYAWLNVRLQYLISTNQIDRARAEKYLNDNLSLVAVYVDKQEFIADPIHAAYGVFVEPAVEKFIIASLESNNYALVFDELIGYGRSYMALMQYLLKATKGNEDVLRRVRLQVPSAKLQYIERADRLDLTAKNPGGSFVYQVLNDPILGDILIVDDSSIRINELDHYYIFRIYTNDGVLDKSIWVEFNPQTPEA